MEGVGLLGGGRGTGQGKGEVRKVRNSSKHILSAQIPCLDADDTLGTAFCLLFLKPISVSVASVFPKRLESLFCAFKRTAVLG